MFTLRSKQYCSCVLGGRPVWLWQEPGSALTPPTVYVGGNSPCPTLMPPESVPALFVIRLLAIWMLCPQPCTKMPPPPCELLVTVMPSMLEGLHRKLPGNGFAAVLVFVPHPLGLVALVLLVSSTVPAGKTPASTAEGPVPNGLEPAGNRIPFASTVMPAPSSAPINEGSCSSSAMLPFC